MREVRNYIRRISENLAAGRGIWFSGDVGTGKTTLAMLISKAAMEADHTVAIYSLPRLLSILRETYDDDARYRLTEFIDMLCSVDLLHIDDVGAEQSTDWVLEQLYTIFNTRYEDGKAVLLTTNLVGGRQHGVGRTRIPAADLRRADRRAHGLADLGDLRRSAADVRPRPAPGEAVQPPRAGRRAPHARPVRRHPLGGRRPALRAATACRRRLHCTTWPES